MEKKCPFCNKKFRVKYPSWSKKYCSKECYDNSRRADFVECHCKFCNKILTIRKYRFDSGRGGYCSRRCANKDSIGENGHNWKGGIYPLDLALRKKEEYILWRNLIFRRDDYKCQICGDNDGGNLQAHHIKKYSANKESRLLTSNGITLCEGCHIGIVTHHEESWESYFNFNLMTRGFL